MLRAVSLVGAIALLLSTASQAAVVSPSPKTQVPAFSIEALESRIGLLCHNDPVNNSDPTGLGVIEDFDGGLGDAWTGDNSQAIYHSLGIEKSVDTTSGAYNAGRMLGSLFGGASEMRALPPKTAFQIAQEGGRHAGFLKNYLNKTLTELKNGMNSLKKQIAEHQAKIANPEKAMPNFKQLDPRQQKALLEKKWPSDIKRQQEQLEILKKLHDKQ